MHSLVSGEIHGIASRGMSDGLRVALAWMRGVALEHRLELTRTASTLYREGQSIDAVIAQSVTWGQVMRLCDQALAQHGGVR